MNYTDGRKHFLETDEATMRQVEIAHAAFVAQVQQALQRAVYPDTKESLTDLINGLADLRGDHIAPVIDGIDEALGLADTRAEQRHQTGWIEA